MGKKKKWYEGDFKYPYSERIFHKKSKKIDPFKSVADCFGISTIDPWKIRKEKRKEEEIIYPSIFPDGYKVPEGYWEDDYEEEHVLVKEETLNDIVPKELVLDSIDPDKEDESKDIDYTSEVHVEITPEQRAHNIRAEFLNTFGLKNIGPDYDSRWDPKGIDPRRPSTVPKVTPLSQPYIKLNDFSEEFDSSDCYHKFRNRAVDELGDLGRRILKIHSLYKDYDDYITAIRDYRKYLEELRKRYNPALFKVLYETGALPEYLPPIPRMKETPSNIFRARHGVDITTVNEDEFYFDGIVDEEVIEYGMTHLGNGFDIVKSKSSFIPTPACGWDTFDKRLGGAEKDWSAVDEFIEFHKMREMIDEGWVENYIQKKVKKKTTKLRMRSDDFELSPEALAELDAYGKKVRIKAYKKAKKRSELRSRITDFSDLTADERLEYNYLLNAGMIDEDPFDESHTIYRGIHVTTRDMINMKLRELYKAMGARVDFIDNHVNEGLRTTLQGEDAKLAEIERLRRVDLGAEFEEDPAIIEENKLSPKKFHTPKVEGVHQIYKQFNEDGTNSYIDQPAEPEKFKDEQDLVENTTQESFDRWLESRTDISEEEKEKVYQERTDKEVAKWIMKEEFGPGSNFWNEITPPNDPSRKCKNPEEFNEKVKSGEIRGITLRL